MSTDPIAAAALIVTEADSIKAEIAALLASLNGRHPTRAMFLRARELRKRLKALDTMAENLLLREMSLEIAVRQRLGCVDVEGQEILPADEWRADQILAGVRLC